MKWLEIIEFGYSESERIFLEKDIEILIGKLNKESDKLNIKIYSRVSTEADFRILMHHKSNELKKNGSLLGNDLSSILGGHGRVKHSIWV